MRHLESRKPGKVNSDAGCWKSLEKLSSQGSVLGHGEGTAEASSRALGSARPHRGVLPGLEMAPS